MIYLYKIFHQKDYSEFKKEYQKRLHAPGTTRTDFHIKPMNQPDYYELYYVPTDQITSLVNNIQRTTRNLERIFFTLPSVAQNQFINECLIEELYHTNDLEGVRSTREEIVRSTRDVQQNLNSNKRFKSMIRTYINLLNGDITYPEKAEDIRKIYNETASEEISSENLLDGEIFRKEATFILKKSGSGKVIHTGLTPEDKIINAVNHVITFMDHDDDEIPMLIKVAISHYYFGYIHPFYDGNGRTSRFISSIYLYQEIGNIGSLSLSRACNQYRNQYLKAFDTTNSIKNHGEMNYFIESFLQIILHTLQSMLEEMQEKYHLLQIAKEKIKKETKLKNKPKKFKDIMFIVAQNYFFESNVEKGITIKELAKERDLSQPTVRKMIEQLKELDLVETKGQRPVYVAIPQRYFEG